MLDDNPQPVVLVCLYLDVDYYYLSALERVTSSHLKILFLVAREFKIL